MGGHAAGNANQSAHRVVRAGLDRGGGIRRFPKDLAKLQATILAAVKGKQSQRPMGSDEEGLEVRRPFCARKSPPLWRARLPDVVQVLVAALTQFLLGAQARLALPRDRSNNRASLPGIGGPRQHPSSHLESLGTPTGPADYSRELYAELHALAARWLRDQRKNHSLQATDLVHEAFLRLHAGRELPGQDRVGFLALASTAMRCALVDHARSRGRRKRSPPGERVPVDAILVEYEDRAVDMLALDEALRRLDRFDPDMASAVELRFFGGLSAKEAADFLGIPQRTFERRWSAVRAWLRAEVG